MEKNELPTAAILGVFGVIALLLLLGTGLLNPLLERLAKSPTGSGVSPVLRRGGGGLIAFESHRDGNPEIYVMNQDGSFKQNLTDNPANDWGPAWSPDGGRIAFLSQRTGKSQVYVMNVDGSGLIQLTGDDVDANWAGPLSWSPDGSRLVATAYFSRTDNWTQSLLYLVHADGSGIEPLIPTPESSFNDSRPIWSPDGKRIAYLSYRYNTTGLYLVDLDTRSETTLSVSGSFYIPVFDWYPDGTKLAYLSIVRIPQEASENSSQLRAVDVDGKNDILLHSFEKMAEPYSNWLAWSPDGSRLALTADFGTNANGSSPQPQLYHLWADGSGLTPLMSTIAIGGGLSWSPDGDWIAIVSGQGGGSNVYLMNTSEFYLALPDRSVVRFTGSGKDQNPQWQPK